MGAGLFITTTVIGTVLLVTRGRNYNIGESTVTMYVYASNGRSRVIDHSGHMPQSTVDTPLKKAIGHTYCHWPHLPMSKSR